MSGRVRQSILPLPGQLVFEDFRSANVARQTCPTKTLKLLQWNIERGYQLDKIVEQLRCEDADIVSLQEIDVDCDRSNCRNVGTEIARALGYNYVFICEFQELRSPIRNASSQGGGVHGNGLLSKFQFGAARVIEHSHHPVDWENPKHFLAQQEPRKGRRLTLAAEVNTSDGILTVYSCHLEVFCGLLDRVRQFADIFRDCRQHPAAHQAILGDLNTMANGIARLSPHYCCDQMRWRSVGWSEAQWWECHVFGVTGVEVNQHLLGLGLGEQVARDMVNPGFHDPFDPARDITLDNPKYRLFGWPLMTGKLDWVLLKGFKVLSKSIGNHDFSASDHKWLSVEVELDKTTNTGVSTVP